MSDYLGRHSGKTIDDSIQAVIDYNLLYVEDVKTTRLQVLARDRVAGTTIGYVNNNTFISEHYIGSLFTDEEWGKDANWQKGSYNKVDKESGKELIPTLLLQKLNGMVNIKTIGADLILTPSGELSAVAGGSSDYSSLSNKPSIGGIELTGNKSLATLGIQPAGAYITQTSLTNTLTSYPTKTESNNFYVAKEEGKRLITEEEASSIEEAVTSTTLSVALGEKVDKEEGGRLITDVEVNKLASAVTPQELSDGLATKVTAEPNQRLITDQEATKLGLAVISDNLEPYSLKDTGVLEEITEIPIEEEQYIKLFDEEEDKEKKISITNLILGVSNSVYPTYRSLVGTQNGSNTQFKYPGTLIRETAELYIGGFLYPLNIGFTFEGVDTILITGAPTPTSEDIMRLKAIYLT